MATIARNLGMGGRRRRLLVGAVVMAVAVVGAALMVAGGLPRGARPALFLLFFAGAVGLLQYRDHT